MTNYHTPAFPALAHWDRNGQKSAALQFPGMTLLDHFAGLALPVITAEIYSWGRKLDGGTVPELAAKMSYELANAMLKEREKWIK